MTPQRIIEVSDGLVKGDAKLLIDKKDQVAAAIDIFLDIVMFNSYSFLRNMPLDKKREFNRKKYDYFCNIGESSYYVFSEQNPPAYYSFAFSARETTAEFNFSKYVELWNNFVNTEYKGFKNEVLPIVKQLQKHRDIGNLPSEYLDSEYWSTYDDGDYLLLRINDKPKSTETQDKIASFFGTSPFHIGATKIVASHMYYNTFVRRMIDELFISAYKIVIQNG